jgi:hypothetical protein
MSTVRTTITTTTNPLVLVALVWALVWGFGATQLALPAESGPGPDSGAASALADVDTDALWQSSWSERFPGCVALALWPHDERAVAVLTRGPGGAVVRSAPSSGVQPGHQVVGACR